MKNPIKTLFLFLLTASLIPAVADTLKTKDDQVFKGQVLESSEETIRLKTAYGELSIPQKDVASIQKSKRGKKPPIKLSHEARAKLHMEALRLMEDENWKTGIKRYQEILRADPKDQIAHYNTACAHARLGSPDKALKSLEKAMKSGFVDFRFIEADPDLNSLHDLEGYKALAARQQEFSRKAKKTSVAQITSRLKEQGIDAEAYKTFSDEERNFVYLHTRSDEDFQAIRDMLNEYAELQWKNLFPNKPGSPVYIVLLTRKDSPKALGRSRGGVFNPGANILYCGHMPGRTLLNDNVIIHEFTHALHFADLAVRRQQHPPWLVEGLASLFETHDIKDGKVVPRHSHRLGVVQQAVKNETALPWTEIMNLKSSGFMKRAHINYAQARYMLFYLYEKGLLKPFYDDYTQGDGFESDKSAGASFEKVFGKPLAEVESDWKTWLLEQDVPPVPFLGVSMEQGDGAVKVTDVIANSSADKGGLKGGDLLIQINGKDMPTPQLVMETIREQEVGVELSLEIKRDGEVMTLNVELGSRPRSIHDR